ncbi:MAG: hypothetical protein Q8O24_02060 [Gallionellaceae bacterium]|nr:hypothetical protein [Gallionellaceae bacterium]
MSEIIHAMAQVQLPADLLQQIDMDVLLKNFKDNHKKLGDFKKIRDKHEKRNIFSSWWNNDEIEDAQLSAVEVQAEYSKAVGQLMVLSIVQSQYLEKQQILLSEQQKTIRTQTNNIERHNNLLEEQHKDLAAKSTEIKNLLDHYFELKGLTRDGAQQLVAIANDVKGTKAILEKSVDTKLADSLRQVGLIEAQIQSQTDNALSSIHASMSNLAFETNKSINQLRDEAIAQLEIAENLISTLQEDFKRVETEAQSQREAIKLVEGKHGELGSQIGELSGATSLLNNALAVNNTELKTVRSDLDSEKAFSIGVDQKLDTISRQFEEYQSNVSLKLGRLQIMLGVSLVLAIGLTVFILFRM